MSKEIYVAIEGRLTADILRTLAHEMVHARQFLRGELTCEGGFAWKGNNASEFKYKDHPNVIVILVP